jgi:hypothetical protein
MLRMHRIKILWEKKSSRKNYGNKRNLAFTIFPQLKRFSRIASEYIYANHTMYQRAASETTANRNVTAVEVAVLVSTMKTMATK